VPLPIWLFILASVIKSAVVLGVLLTAVAYTVWLERKVVGRMQNRWGPTRVGPFGLLQPAADGIKFLFKEDLTPPHVYKPLYIAAPLIAVIFALTSIAVIPFGNSITIGGYSIPLQITDVNIGLLMILGVTSIGVYGVALAGWSSNNKYSLLGALRSSAQMISYELALGLSLVGVVLRAGSLNLREIVNQQARLGIATLECLWRIPTHCFLHLLDGRVCRDQPHRRSICLKLKASSPAAITPNTAR
jgi:NADH-quinone oxidoreductase subunit H